MSIKFILLGSIGLLLLSACSNKVCHSKDSYDGLYHALTCDYKTRIVTLEKKNTKEELKEVTQFNAYQHLVAEANSKESEVLKYQESIQEINKLISSVEIDIKALKSAKTASSLLKKIRYQIIAMRDKIKVQPVKFNQPNLQYVKKYLKSKKYKIEKTTLVDKKYLKKYQKTLQVKKKIEQNLTQSIENILESEKADHLTKENKDRLLVVLKEARRYTRSVE